MEIGERRRRKRFSALSVLVVEDNFWVAEELLSDLEDDGFRVLGPVSSVDAAFRLLETDRPDAAILDINLGGYSVQPLADALVLKGTPLAFYTAYDSSVLPEHLRSFPCIQKPERTRVVLDSLEALLDGQTAVRHSIRAILPDLREKAASIAGGARPGDALLEDALKMAIVDLHEKSPDIPTARWLDDLLQVVARRRGFVPWQ